MDRPERDWEHSAHGLSLRAASSRAHGLPWKRILSGRNARQELPSLSPRDTSQALAGST